MAYNAHNWIHEEVIYAQTLNHAELGIQQNAADIASEVNARTQAVANEKTRAEGIEGGLRTDVTTLQGSLSAEITNRAADVDAEQARAEGVESSLNTAISNEVTRATGAEGNLSNALSLKVDTVSVGVANGVASLDSTGKVPSNQLPSYVDDVIEGYYKTADGKFYEESTYTTEITGETGKIYIDLNTDKTYRWSGSVFVEITSSPLVLTTTLTAGNTTVTFTDGKIASATIISILTDTGIAPTAQSVSGSTYTATFEVQSADMEVAIEVK